MKIRTIITKKHIKTVSFFLSLIVFTVLGSFLALKYSTKPLYAQTSSYWNVERDGSNNLNFYFVNNGANGKAAIRISPTGPITNGSPGLDSGITGDLPYSYLYQESGAWSSPFPDLVIGYHTGMKLGSYFGYGGIKFFNDHPSRSTTQLFSVGDGDQNVRVANWLNFPNTSNTGISAATNNATFYPNNGTHGAWRISGNRGGWYGLEFDTNAGQLALMMGHSSQNSTNNYTGVYNASNAAWNWYAVGQNMHAAQFVDMQNGGYYIDPNSQSNVSALYRTYGFNGPEYDGNNAGYYVDPNATSNFVDLRMSYMYDNNDTSYYLDLNNTSLFNDLRANVFYDRANTGYYMQPRAQSRMNNIWLDYMSCMSSWCPQNYVARLTPNLHLNSVGGYAVYLNWDNGSSTGLQFSVGNGGGSHMFHVRGDGYAEVAGSMRVGAQLGINGYGPMGCGGYGLCVGGAAYTNASWQGSDIRLKKEITPITGALDKILKLEGVTYRLKDESKDPGTLGGKHFGFIAQQVENTIPEAVSTSPEGYRAMEYAPLTALLTEGIKEQQQQLNQVNENLKEEKKINEEQQKEIDQLKQTIVELQIQINALKNK